MVEKRNFDTELAVKIFDISETEVEKLDRLEWYRIIESMMKCPTIRFCYFFSTLPIRRARLYYQHQSREIQQFVTDNLSQIRRNLTQDILYGFQFGFLAFEKRFRVFDRRVHYKEFFPIEPRYTEIVTKNGSFDGFIVKKHKSGTVFSQELVEITVPAWKSFIFTNEFAFRNYYGKSFLTSAYIPWLLWKETIRLHGHAMSDFVLPAMIIRAPEGEGTYNIDGSARRIRHAEYMMRAAQAARSRSVVYMPPGPDYSIELLQVSRAWDFSKDYSDWERMMALALLIPRDLFREGGGSYAKAREQSFWFAQAANALLQQIIDFVYPFLIVSLIQMNFEDRQKPVRENFGELFFESISARDSEFLQSLVEKFLEDKKRPDWNEILRILHVPQESETKLDDELPLTKASLEKAFRKILISEFDGAKRDLGFDDDGISVRPSVLNLLKTLSEKTLSALTENTDRSRIISESIKTVKNLGRAAAYFAIEGGLDGKSDQSDSDSTGEV